MRTDEEIAKQVRQRWAALKQERASFEPHWQELADFILPRRHRTLVSKDRNRGERANQKILDSTGTQAARTLSSGMMAGLTSPAREWFRLSTPHAELNERADVKAWLHSTEMRIREVFNRSNIYAVLPLHYQDLGVFGTGAFAVLEDEEDIIRAYHFPVGSYALANSFRMAVDTFYREFSLTVAQLVGQFARQRDGSIDWSIVSRRVKSLYETGKHDDWITVLHAIEPNEGDAVDPTPGQRPFTRMPYRSCYLEAECQSEDRAKVLRVGGFEEFPIVASRWTLTDSDVYGTSPGMDCLGDIKALQLEQRRKAQAIDKLVNPPMNAPASLRTKRAKMLPGDVNYVDQTGTGQGLSPAFLIRPEIQHLLLDIQENQQRINRGFYVDLFLALTMSDRRQITAREIEERHEEKLLMLGPVLERLNGEQNDPLIDRTFAIMLRRGMLDEPPSDLSGVDLKVEYISMLAQAQRSVGTAGIERLAGFVTAAAAVHPDVLDKMDFDQAVDEYGDMLGVPPKVVRTDSDVDGLRAAKQQQQQQAMTAAAAPGLARATRDLGETPLDGDTALTRMLAQSAGAGAGAGI